LWEAHARGPNGAFSPALSAAHLHDLFGALGLTRPVDGEMHQAENLSLQTPMRPIDFDSDTHQPTEVELAY
jgi:hypothetical protein